MKKIMDYSAHLKKNGYVLIKNFFDKDDIKEIKDISEKLHSKNIKSVPNLHNFNFSWKLLVNQKLMKFLKEFYNPDKVYYLYNSHSVKQKNDEPVDPNWHRDNAHRIFGKGDDWNNGYNVLRVGIYLNEKDKDTNGIRLIKKSHVGGKFICFLLRTLRSKFKRLYFNRLFRYFFDKIVGTTVYPKFGDCLFFYANIYHAAFRDKSVGYRKAIFLSYGTKNIHSENFLNYYIFHHKINHRFDKEKNNFDEFIKLINQNDLYSNLPSERKLDKDLTI